MTAGDVYRALWRHSVLIVALTAAFVLTTWYLVLQQEKTYEASTIIRIQYGTNSNPGFELEALEAGERLALAYANIVGSGALDGRVASLVASVDTGGGRRDVDLSASAEDGLEIFRVSARSDRPAIAAAVANAVPRALRGLIEQTQSSRASVVVLSRATTPSVPVAPRIGLTIALAALLAFIFNGALALLLEVFRGRLPDSDDLEEFTGHPVLATVPTLRLHRFAAGGADEDEPQEGLLAGRSAGASAASNEARRDR